MKCLAEKGAIAVKDLDLFQFADTPEEAFRIVTDGLIKNHIDPADLRAAWRGAHS